MAIKIELQEMSITFMVPQIPFIEVKTLIPTGRE